MKMTHLACLIAMLLIAHPAFAQPTVDDKCISQEPIDMGDIGKEKLSFIENGSLSPGEMDWFKFNVIDSAKFFMKVAQTENYYTDFAMVIYDENMNFTAQGGDMIFLDLKAGPYYLRLDARTNERVNYTLTASNNIETESNDGLSEANDIGILKENQIFFGSIEPVGDSDFIKMEVPEGKSTGLIIDGEHSSLSLVLYGYNESRKYYLPLVEMTDTLYTTVDPGTYYLRIEGYPENYTLNISLATMDCDEEPNDSFAEAIDIGTLNASAPLTKTGCVSSGDGDYYRFSIPENTRVTMKTITDGDTYLYLYDSEEDQLEYNDDYDGLASQIEKRLDPGDYYLMVQSYGSIVKYEISVEETD
jgi:hypothetical protein